MGIYNRTSLIPYRLITMKHATQVAALAHIMQGREDLPIALFELSPCDCCEANTLCVADQQEEMPWILSAFEEGHGDYTQQVIYGEESLGYILTFVTQDNRIARVYTYRQG